MNITKTICADCDDLADVKPEYKNKWSNTVGELREIIKDMDDDAIIVYQRIEDVYFEKHGWKPELLIPEYYSAMSDEMFNNEYIGAFCSFKYEKDGKQYLCITAHY